MPTANGPHNQPRFDVNDDADFAADMTTVSDYAAKVGNIRVGPTTDRTSASGLDVWEGLWWSDTTDGLMYRYTGTSWIPYLGDSGWKTPAPLAGTAGTAQYRKRNGMVFFQGTWTPTADSQAMWRLDAGFRPANTGTWWCERGSTAAPAAKIEVQASSGFVIFRQSGGSGPINFSGLGPFIADQ